MKSLGTGNGGGGNDRNGVITGVSLPSFLQVLELEKNSCLINVASGENKGVLYLKDGNLIDAETEFNVGLEAVYSVCSWEDPIIQVGTFYDRMRRIHKTLTHILLDVARKKDETKASPADQENISAPQFSEVTPRSQVKNNNTSVAADISENVRQKFPAVGRCLDILSTVPGLRHYFFLNRHGRVIIQSSDNRKIADFITYCVITGLQMGEQLEVKGPQMVLLTMEDYEELLIIPKGGMIIGLLLEENIYVPDVINQLQPVLKI